MRLETWMESREQPGTLPNVAKRAFEKGSTPKQIERGLQGFLVMEALRANGWNITRAANSLSVSRMKIVRTLRAMEITAADVRRLATQMKGRTDAGTAA